MKKPYPIRHQRHAIEIAIADAGATPCEVFQCRSFQACAERLMACLSFHYYVAKNKVRPTPDDPSKARYRAIYEGAAQ